MSKTLKKLLVIKLGTSAITLDDGNLDRKIIAQLVRQIAELHEHYRIVLVSSGAVGTGRQFIKDFGGSVTKRKAAAAVGNPLLIDLYSRLFEPYGIVIAQSLCERQHFADSYQFTQLKQTFQELWRSEIIPIVNENDVVSDREIKFSDNDELATLMAVGFQAATLLLGTVLGGVFDHHDQLVTEIDHFDAEIMSYARPTTSEMGIGGMTSKLTFARLATGLGVRTVICSIEEATALSDALAGRNGTNCLASTVNEEERLSWLSSSSSLTGTVKVTAAVAVELTKGKSLSTADISSVGRNFGKGEIIELQTRDGLTFAVAKAELSSAHLMEVRQNNRGADPLLLTRKERTVIL